MNQFYGSDCRRPFQAKRRTLSAPWFHGTGSRKLLGTVSATGVPRAGPHTGDGVAHDSDILIILTLCTVMCVLGLGSVVRCALRCRERVGLESAEHVTVRLAKMGMKKEAIDALPATVYASGSHLPETATDCPICLAEFAEGETVRMLPICNHSFHVQCIDTWLRSQSSCPSCRHSLRDVEEKSAKATLSCTTLRSSETRDTRTGQQTIVGESSTSESIRGIPNHATVQIGSAPPASSVGSGDGAEDIESGINIITSN